MASVETHVTADNAVGMLFPRLRFTILELKIICNVSRVPFGLGHRPLCHGPVMIFTGR